VSGDQWDVIIVGASLAGLAAARAALNRKLKVLILEQWAKPKKLQGSGVVGAETGRLIEEKFQIPLSKCLHKVAYLKGVKFHGGDGAVIVFPYTVPAFHLDRDKLQTQLLYSLRQTPAMFSSRVKGVDLGDPSSTVIAGRDGQDWRFQTHAIINASGCQITGLPRGDRLAHFSGGKSPATHFVARTSFRASVPDPGWHELYLTRRFLSFFRFTGESLNVEMILPSALNWPEAWKELIGYLTGALNIKLFEERAASFNWESRTARWQLGHDKMLNAGDAAGLSTVLGYGVRSAICSGLAAGRAAEFAGHTPDALTVYQKTLESLRREFDIEWSESGIKKGQWIIGPDKMTFRQLVKDLSPWKRWKILREAQKRLELFVKPNPSRAQLPNKTR
jgi:flavin-dependent dehydrogenase